jgi:hypothetical protein
MLCWGIVYALAPVSLFFSGKIGVWYLPVCVHVTVCVSLPLPPFPSVSSNLRSLMKLHLNIVLL